MDTYNVGVKEMDSHSSTVRLLYHKKVVGTVDESFFKLLRFPILWKYILSYIPGISELFVKINTPLHSIKVKRIVKFNDVLSAEYMLNNNMVGLFCDKFKLAFKSIDFKHRCERRQFINLMFSKVFVEANRLDMIEIIFKKIRSTVMPLAINAACVSGSIETVRYAISQGCKPSSSTPAIAMRHGRTQILELFAKCPQFHNIIGDQISFVAVSTLNFGLMESLIDSNYKVPPSSMGSIKRPFTQESYQFGLKLKDYYETTYQKYPEKWDIDLLYIKQRIGR